MSLSIMRPLRHLKSFTTKLATRLLEFTAPDVLRPRITPVDMNAPCVRCGCRYAYPLNSEVHPDFDLSAVPASLRGAFTDHADAICCNCGLYQAYRRFDECQLEMINGIGKDALTTDEVYHAYPVPKDFIDAWYGNSVERQRARWVPFIHDLGLEPRRILMLRYWLGRQFPMLRDAFDAELYGVDISPICTRHVAEHYPFVHQLQGSINGALTGPFVAGPPFDLVIVQHVLVHAVDVVKEIATLRHLVRDGGLVLLSAETKVAPTNPFHKYYPSEYQTVSLLSQHFDRVFKLDEDGPIAEEALFRYTGRAVEFAGYVKPPAEGNQELPPRNSASRT